MTSFNSPREDESNILVAVRCRPLNEREKQINDLKTVHVLDSNIIVIIDPYATANKRNKEKHYKFDLVFNESSGQSDIFAGVCRGVIDGVLDGYNSTIFAYGPTGSGKTFSMLGSVEDSGLIPRALFQIFEKISQYPYRTYSIKISYLEIYNEVLKDLLNPSSLFLDIREDPQKGITISDLSEVQAVEINQINEIIKIGSKRRTCEPTEANKVSSRSHAILIVNIDYKDGVEGKDGVVFASKFSMIDLAGSERAANTKNRGIRLVEGANINRSLLALGNCINALYEVNSKGAKNYIPYRDSKLTRLLKDSLGGKCKTVMIACISPFHAYYEDTHNTLEYANRAKNIKTKIEQNAYSVDVHMIKYKEIITELKNEIKELRKVVNEKGEKSENGVGFDSTQGFLREIEEHFKKESKVKISAFQILKEIDRLNEEVLIKEIEVNEERFGGDSKGVPRLEQYLEETRKNLQEKEKSYSKIKENLKDLEKKRENFQAKWSNLPKDVLVNLRLNLQKNIIRLYEIEREQNSIHEENKLKCKDLYIAALEAKLKERIISLERQDVVSMDERNTDGKSNPKKMFLSEKKLKSELLLPPISPPNKVGSEVVSRDSRIPRYKPKMMDEESSSSSTHELNKGVGKGKSMIPRKGNKGGVAHNSDSEVRNGGLPKIADKYKRSRYVNKGAENRAFPQRGFRMPGN